MYDSPFGSPKCSVVGLLAPVVVPLSPAQRRANIDASAALPSSLAQRRKEAAHSTEGRRLKGKRNGTGKGGDLGTLSMEALTKP